MEIRSITLFADADFDRQQAAAFFQASRAGYPRPVQTTRLATSPFPGWWRLGRFTAAQARQMGAEWTEAGADYVSLGPVQLRHDAGWLDEIPEIIASSERLFVSAEVADRAGRIDVGRCLAVAEVIRRLSGLHPNGFGNVSFAALANCGPGVPFFPAAYHEGGPPSFALAIQGADLLVEAIGAARSLAQARQNVVAAIEREAGGLVESAEALAAAHGIAFAGIDFTPAPFPGEAASIAGALEALGLPGLGGPGSIFAAAFLADAIGRAKFPRAGLSGLMLSVLEDSLLAERAGAGQVQVSDLLAYSSVCTIGADLLPLPGDTSQEALAGLLLDVAALAVRLNKPLMARLMPLPGLKPGDRVSFDFPYFAPSRVMAIGDGVRGLLGQEARPALQPLPGLVRGD